jgi:hypothetical protein
MAPLQKRALGSLLPGLVLTAVSIVLFVSWGGVQSFASNSASRLILSALFVAMLLAAGMLLNVPRRARNGLKVEVDERDFAIMRRAPQVQLPAVILTLAAWVIGLTEYYWGVGVIPVMWPYLMMWSVLIASTLAQSLGVLIGYPRSQS